MDNIEFRSSDFPDFSILKESTELIHTIVQPVLEAVKNIQDIIQPFRRFAEQSLSWLTEATKDYSGAIQTYHAIQKLGEAQFVCWFYLSDEFVDEINASENINKTLRQYMLQDKLARVKDTIEKTNSNQKMRNYHRLYNQSVDAFKAGSYDLAVTGFTSVFDGLIAEINEDTSTKLKAHVAMIKQKLRECRAFRHDEIAIMALGFTIGKTLDSFTDFSAFNKKEPKGLNRHWIAHGRSHKKRTKLDCVKMINLIYGLLLITELDSTGPIESE